MILHTSFMCGVSFKIHAFVLNHKVLIDKINLWNGMSREWKYWETITDHMNNLLTLPEPIPLFEMGWYGPLENQGEINFNEKSY